MNRTPLRACTAFAATSSAFPMAVSPYRPISSPEQAKTSLMEESYIVCRAVS